MKCNDLCCKIININSNSTNFVDQRVLCTLAWWARCLAGCGAVCACFGICCLECSAGCGPLCSQNTMEVASMLKAFGFSD